MIFNLYLRQSGFDTSNAAARLDTETVLFGFNESFLIGIPALIKIVVIKINVKIILKLQRNRHKFQNNKLT